MRRKCSCRRCTSSHSRTYDSGNDCSTNLASLRSLRRCTDATIALSRLHLNMPQTSVKAGPRSLLATVELFLRYASLTVPGAVAHRLRFLRPTFKPDVPISRIRITDGHLMFSGADCNGTFTR